MNVSITPVWFPFTWVSPEWVRRLPAVLTPLTVYRVSAAIPPGLQPMADDPRVRIRNLFEDDRTELDKRVSAYRKWMASHTEADAAFLRAQPFLQQNEDALSSDIRAEILRYETPRSPSDPVLSARVFLAIAEEFDCQQQELSRDLNRFQEQESRFREQLAEGGELPGFDPASLPIPADRPLDHMPAERLKAWSTVFLRDRKLPEDGSVPLFVTDSRLVMDLARELVPEIRPIPPDTAPDPDEAFGAAAGRLIQVLDIPNSSGFEVFGTGELSAPQLFRRFSGDFFPEDGPGSHRNDFPIGVLFLLGS